MTLANDAYAPGLAALLQSLVEHSGEPNLEMTVLVDGQLSAPRRAALDASGVSLDYVLLSDLGVIPPKAHTRGRWRLTLQKLVMFRLPLPGPLAYIDSDILCLRTLGLDALPAFAAAPEYSQLPMSLPDGTPIFNAGFFTFTPDVALFDEILDFYVSSTHRFTLGDQSVLNAFFHERRPGTITYLDGSWNTLTTYLDSHPEATLDDVRLLHYVSQKPWRNMWVPKPGGTRRLVDLYELWWEHYRRSPMAEIAARRRPPLWAIRWSHSGVARPAWSVVRGARSALGVVSPRFAPKDPETKLQRLLRR